MIAPPPPRAPWSASLGQVALASLAGHLERVPERWLPQLSLRWAGEDVSPRQALASAGWHPGRQRADLALYLHGLFIDESNWLWGEQGLAQTLPQQLGWTPLLVRYNAGLSLEENAASLAALIEELVAEAGPSCGEVHLLGHSLGGLLVHAVVRALLERGSDVVDRIGMVLYLATPFYGAPLAQAMESLAGGPSDAEGASWLRGLLEIRGQGLRRAGVGVRGQALAGWAAPSELSLGVRSYSVAGSLWPVASARPEGRRHDGLVTVASAAGWSPEEGGMGFVERGQFTEIPRLAHQFLPASTRVRDVIVRFAEGRGAVVGAGRASALRG